MDYLKLCPFCEGEAERKAVDAWNRRCGNAEQDN